MTRTISKELEGIHKKCAITARPESFFMFLASLQMFHILSEHFGAVEQKLLYICFKFFIVDSLMRIMHVSVHGIHR